MPIRILPTVTINRIAAGEVIEHPASVVKELVENAIDAGATRIDVTLEQGGKNLVKVVDNGKGMRKEELSLAIERHATSKLPDDDLLNIAHFGFRGEALPSIGSVGRLTITSHPKEDCQQAGEAWSITVNGGAIEPVQPASHPQGTTVALRDLFFATPARLKFLKSDRSEQQYTQDHMKRFAMANPHIAFSLTCDGKTQLQYGAEQGELWDSRLQRLSRILGKDFADNTVAIDAEREGITIGGYVSLPTYNRGVSTAQYVFVNNRPIKDKLIMGAIKGAYQDFLARNRYPVLALFIALPNQEVDVNVHPAKSEVRFRDSQLMRSLLVSSIKQALSGAGHHASTTVADQALRALNPESGSYPASQQGNLSYQYQPASRHYHTPPPASFHALSEASASAYNSGSNVAGMTPFTPQAQHEEGQFVTQSDIDNSFPLGAARAQLHETYIVAQTQDSIVIVDQHAAHERLVYERMKKQLEASGIIQQPLLIAEIVEMEEQAVSALLKQATLLAQLGLSIEPFGHNGVEVRAVPSLLGDVDVQKLVKNLADDLLEHGEALSLTEALEHVTETAACHGSIRSGRRLNTDEMNAILREMEATPYSGQCNHGRPTYVELKLKDIETLFGRR